MSEKKWIASDGVTELKPGMLVLGRDSISSWTVDIFSHIERDSPYEFVCAGGSVYTMCIPLEVNEHMAGTTLPIPRKEKPFKWGEKVFVWDEDEEEKKLAIFLNDLDVALEARYEVICAGHHRESLWRYCARAPLDADAEQE